MTDLQIELQNEVESLDAFMNSAAYYSLSVPTRRTIARKRIKITKELIEVYETSLQEQEQHQGT